MTIELLRNGAVATVRLNRPEKLNALTDEMKHELPSIFGELNADESVRAIILTGAGRGFCAGGDVSTMTQFTAASAKTRIQAAQRVILALANVEKPVIASVRGPVAGIGWSLALACDMVVASETAKFQQSFMKIGLVPDGGSLYFLTQILGTYQAKELVYRTRPMPAKEALERGLANYVVPDQELEAETTKIADEFGASPGFALGIAKKMFKSLNVPSLETFLDTEAWAQSLALLSEDHAEGALAFREKRLPVFKGR